MKRYDFWSHENLIDIYNLYVRNEVKRSHRHINMPEARHREIRRSPRWQYLLTCFNATKHTMLIRFKKKFILTWVSHRKHNLYLI